MDTAVLEGIGLTQGEAKVYLALSDIGQSTTGPIGKKSGISLSKVYEILERLVKKGLAGFVYKNKTKYFYAAPPEKIMGYVEQQEKDILKRKDVVARTIIPQLAQKRESAVTPSATVYEGIEGMKTVFNNFLERLRPDEEYLVFTVSPEELLNPRWQMFFRNYHLRRQQKSIRARMIAPESARPAMGKIFRKISGVSVRYTSQKIPHNTSMYKDFLVLTSFTPEPVAVEINIPLMTRQYATLFEDIWSKASAR